jgi:hypothetical protein
MKKLFVITGILIAIIGVSALAEAKMSMLNLNVWTNSYNNTVSFFVNMRDRTVFPPETLISLTLTAPDGTVFNTSTFKWRDAGSGYFYAEKPPTAFIGGVIPSGTYSVTAVDNVGTTITATDYLTVNMLSAPTITYPTNGMTVGQLNFSIQWNPVPGATYYRIYLWNNTDNQPIWWWDGRFVVTNLNYFRIPKGVLWNGYSYSVKIEPRDDYEDLDNRSRSDWIQFNTPSP